MKVVIDGVEYVPKVDVPSNIKNERLHEALLSLTEIQYFPECSHKHRAWAWEALNALAPDLAAMTPEAAFKHLRRDEE